MAEHLTQQIERLKKAFPQLGDSVRRALRAAIEALESLDPNVAAELEQGDARIDQLEIDLEEDCLHCLTLEQPVAGDLRLIVGTIKIIAELERIGDQSVSLAEQARYLNQAGATREQLHHLPAMAVATQRMVDQVLNAIERRDASMAREVRRMDDQVDTMHRRTYELVEQGLGTDVKDEVIGIHLLNVSRRLERIADHAVSMADDALYIIDGRITRHGSSGRDWPETG